MRKEDFFHMESLKEFFILSITVFHFLPSHKTNTYLSYFKMLVDNHRYKCAAKFKNHRTKSYVVLKFLTLSHCFESGSDHMIRFWSMRHEVNSERMILGKLLPSSLRIPDMADIVPQSLSSA